VEVNDNSCQVDGLDAYPGRIDKTLSIRSPPENCREAAIFSGQSPRKNVVSYAGTTAHSARIFFPRARKLRRRKDLAQVAQFAKNRSDF
jgi:hypothetical protein